MDDEKRVNGEITQDGETAQDIAEEPSQTEPEVRDEYKFVSEETKKRPPDTKRFAAKAGKAALCAVIFGVVAAAVFWLVTNLLPEKKNSEEINLSVSETQESVSEETEEPSQAEPEVVPAELTPEDYERLQNEIYKIGEDAGVSVVRVRGTGSGRGWFESDAASEGTSYGVIIADGDEAMYILTTSAMADGAQQLSAEFGNYGSASAHVCASDSYLGIAVIAVSKSDIPDGAEEYYKALELGSSYAVSQGDILIAIGSPQGDAGSVSVGSVTYTGSVLEMPDANYALITTSMEIADSGAGVVLNLSGSAIGVLADKGESGGAQIVGTSEIRSLLENLINGKAAAYTGIHIASLYDSDTDEPSGIYVKSVAEDSPAIAAGIQAGDIITGIGDDETENETQYEKYIEDAASGQDIVMHIKRLSAENTYSDVDCTVTLGER